MSDTGRRIFPRAEGEYPAWYQIADQGFRRCVALDIGVHGACLRVEEQIPENVPLEVSFQLDPDWLVRATATVTWQRADEDLYLVGVQYRPMRSADRNLMGPWVHRQRKRRPNE
jgi:hypothetical protein